VKSLCTCWMFYDAVLLHASGTICHLPCVSQSVTECHSSFKTRLKTLLFVYIIFFYLAMDIYIYVSVNLCSLRCIIIKKISNISIFFHIVNSCQILSDLPKQVLSLIAPTIVLLYFHTSLNSHRNV